jgi:hypothetical protein
MPPFPALLVVVVDRAAAAVEWVVVDLAVETFDAFEDNFEEVTDAAERYEQHIMVLIDISYHAHSVAYLEEG